MPPMRGRPAPDDARLEIANARGEKQSVPISGATKARRNGAAAQATSSSLKDSGSLPNTKQTSDILGNAGISWSAEHLSLLHAYRSAYAVETPSAMSSPLSNAVLTVPGIGRHSPTMAKAKEKRKTGKEQLALAVRKHFNGLAVTETDVVVDFLYAVKFQDQSFKMRFAPPGAK